MISIAPMIGWTDKNYRYLMRNITKQTILYTEMIMDSTLIHNPNKLEDFIDYIPDIEPPLVLQLGGNNPEKLGQAVELSEYYKGGHFTEINLNCGCPSNKAKKAGFGAELMLEPELVRQIVYEMNRKSTKTEITVKCRIGTDKRDKWEDLIEFVEACKQGGVKKMIIHSRICILSGLTPAQNRNIPPLRYEVTHDLVKAFPDMTFILNGGIKSFEQIDAHLGKSSNYLNQSLESLESLESFEEDNNNIQSSSISTSTATTTLTTSLSTDPCCENIEENDYLTNSNSNSNQNPEYHSHINRKVFYPDCTPEMKLLWSAAPVSGVMIGREAYSHPWLFANVDQYYYNTSNPSLSRREVLESYLKYSNEAQQNGEFKSSAPVLCRPLHNFFHGSVGNRAYKRKFDHLIKEYTVGENRNGRDISIDNIVWEAIDGTISDDFLDERMCSDGIMRVVDRER